MPNHCNDTGRCSDQCKRDSLNVGLLRHPVLQGILTWIIAIPHSGQTLRRRHRLENLLTALIALAIGLILCQQALASPKSLALTLLLLTVGYGHTVYALRCLRLPNYHNCTHGDLTKNPKLDYAIGLLLGALLWAPPISAYTRQHAAGPGKTHHKWSHLLVPGEDSFETIRSYGFRPGAPNHENWRHLWLLILNPLFYLRRLAVSLRGAFGSGPAKERAFSLAFWAFILTLVIHHHALLAFAIIWLVPRVIFYEIAQLLRVLVEHYFPLNPPGGRTPADFRTMTRAIFAAEPAPVVEPSDGSLSVHLAWLKWALRMAFLHLPARFWVLTGDTPCHDLHHARPGADWANYEMERQRLAESGYPLRGNWGLGRAIDDFFSSLARQPSSLFCKN